MITGDVKKILFRLTWLVMKGDGKLAEVDMVMRSFPLFTGSVTCAVFSVFFFERKGEMMKMIR